MERSKENYIRWSEDCVWQPFGDTVVILKGLDSESELPLGEKGNEGIRLNEVGKDIWDMCDGTKTLDNIVDQLLKEYIGDAEIIRDNVTRMIADLKENGFLTYEKTLKEYVLRELSLQEYVVWDKTITWKEVGGRIAITDSTGVTVQLSQPVGEIWNLCSGERTVAEIISILKEKGITEIPPSGIKLWIKHFIKRGWLTLEGASTEGIMYPLKRRIVVDLKDGNYLLINSYSGMADIIDKEVLSLLESGTVDIDNEKLRILRRRGHFVAEKGEEDDLFRYMEKMAEETRKEAAQHRTHVIIPTYGCNLRCVYCFEKHLYKKDITLETVVDTSTVDAAFDAIVSLDSDSENSRIELYGGEPLMLHNKSIIEYILKKGDELEYPFQILTNGVDLYHFVPVLSAFTIMNIQVTLDGPQPVHDRRRIKKGGKGSFDDIVKSIDRAVESGLTVTIRINVDADNIDYVPEFADFYKEKGWYPKVRTYLTNVYTSEWMNYSSIIPEKDFPQKMTDLFSAYEELDIFSATFTDPNFILGHLVASRTFSPTFWTCGAHASLFVYDPFGDMYACSEAVGNKDHKIGVYKPTLTFNDVYDHWRKRSVFTIPECRECNLAFFCGGGCAYKAYKMGGSIDTPFCESIKFSLECEAPYTYHKLKKQK